MSQEQPTNPTTPTAEAVNQNRRRHWFYSTPWWTITSLLFCLTFIGLGIGALSIYWSAPTQESGWDFLVGLTGLLGAATGTFALLSAGLTRLGFGKNYQDAISWKLASRLLGACFCFAMVGIMIPMFSSASLRVNEAIARQEAEDALNQPWLSYQIPDGLFSLQTPTNWKLQNKGESGMQLKDEANGLLMVVNAIPKIDSAVKSLSELHDQNLSNFQLNGAVVDNFKRSEIGAQVDRQCQDMIVTYLNQSERTQSFIRHIEFPEHWVSVYFQFRPSKFESNISTMLRIADSVWLSSPHDYVLERYDGMFFQSGQANPYPMRMFVLRKDGAGRIEGVMNWPSLDYAATKFKGTLTGNQFSLTEHEVLTGRHRVVVPVEHKGTIQGLLVEGEATYNGTVSKYQLNRVERSY